MRQLTLLSIIFLMMLQSSIKPKLTDYNQALKQESQLERVNFSDFFHELFKKPEKETFIPKKTIPMKREQKLKIIRSPSEKFVDKNKEHPSPQEKKIISSKIKKHKKKLKNLIKNTRPKIRKNKLFINPVEDGYKKTLSQKEKLT